MSLKSKLEDAGIEMSLILEEDDRIEIYIEGDENDADYVNETGSIDEISELKEVLRVLESFDFSKNHNWDERELSEDDTEIIRDYVPYGSHDDIHSITEVSITLYTKSGERYLIY